MASIITAFGFTFLIGIFVICFGVDLCRGRIRELFIIAGCMMTAGIGAMTATNQNTPGLAIAFSSLGMFGVGALFVAPIVVLTNISSDDIIGTMVGLALSIRLIIGQIGYSIFFNILQAKLNSTIVAVVGAAVVSAGLPVAEVAPFIGALVTKNTTLLAELQGITPAILVAAGEAVDESLVTSFNVVYHMSIGAGVVAIIASAFLPSIRRYMTDRVAVDIH